MSSWPRPITPWTLLLPSDWTIEQLVSSGESSKAEQLLSERKRISNQGILSFQFIETGTRPIRDTILFPYASTLYLGTLDKDGAALNVREVPNTGTGPRLDAKIGGNHGNHIAFVRDRDIWVTSIDGPEQQITFSPDPAISNGSAEYVMQEEFRRYTGYWWKPSRPTDSGHLERILYMEVDESTVEWVLIARPGIDEEVDRYRYPRVGKPNAKARLKIVEFSPKGKRKPIQLALKSPFTIQELFPWAEYLIRAGWMPDLRSVWVQLLDRSQKHTVIIRIPEELFVHQDARISRPANAEPAVSAIHVLYEEQSPYWVNVTDAFSFLSPSSDLPSPVVEFIWPSERTGFRHLYLITCFLNIPSSSSRMSSAASSTAPHPTASACDPSLAVDPLAAPTSSKQKRQSNHQRASSSTASHQTHHRSKRQNTGPVNTTPPLFYPRTHARQITTGEWQVVDNPIVVDAARSLVYFIGKKDTPLETHLYVSCFHRNVTVPVPPFSSEAVYNKTETHLTSASTVSAGAPNTTTSSHAQSLTLRHIEHNIKRLTQLCRSHAATVSWRGTKFVTTSSSVSEPPSTHVYALVHPSNMAGLAENAPTVATAEATAATSAEVSGAPSSIGSGTSTNASTAVDAVNSGTNVGTNAFKSDPHNTVDNGDGAVFASDTTHAPHSHTPPIQQPSTPSSNPSDNLASQLTQPQPQSLSHQEPQSQQTPTHRVYMTRQRTLKAEVNPSQISATGSPRRRSPSAASQHNSDSAHATVPAGKASGANTDDQINNASNSNGHGAELPADWTRERTEPPLFSKPPTYSVDAYRDYMRDHVFPTPVLLTELVSPHVVQPDSSDATAQEQLNQQALIYEGLPVPEIFSFINSDGVKIYGMVYKPINFREGESYPTILRIYGGPNVQIVTNDFKYPKFSRLFMALKFGFAIVMIDSRGSCDRGLLFESYIRHRMGTVELQDQIEALLYLATNGQLMFTPRPHADGTHVVDEMLISLWHQVRAEKQQGRYNGFVDMNRIAVNGWSYGGYLSLMALCHYPSIFKMSLAGAPVTNWELYDTAYTERYMGLLEENRQGYKRGSVLEYAHRFPDTENRLLLVHGLIDENVHFRNTDELISGLARHSKPHQVQVYPSERHGLRAGNVIEHFETLMFWWFLSYL